VVVAAAVPYSTNPAGCAALAATERSRTSGLRGRSCILPRSSTYSGRITEW